MSSPEAEPSKAEPFDLDAWFEEAFQRMEARRAALKLRKENPWVLYLIKVLWPYQSGLRRTIVMDRVRQIRAPKGLNMPKAFENTVQSAFNHHSSQSAVFAGRGAGEADDLFYSPDGKGSGKWAVHRERALAWLRDRELPAP